MPAISQLPAAAPITATNLLPMVQSGVTVKATASQVYTFVTATLDLGTAAFVDVPIIPGDGGTGVSSPTAHTLPVAEGFSNFNFLGPLTNGQLLIGSTGTDPVPSTITAGTNISVINAGGSITISGVGAASFTWTLVTVTTVQMASNNGYIANNSSLVTLKLPLVSSVGDVIRIVGKGSGGWTVTYSTGQYIVYGTITCTTTTGSLSSISAKNTFSMVCTVANTEWTVADGPMGNLTAV